MTLPSRRITDRELELEARIRPADHRFSSSDEIQKRQRALLGPSWGKERRPFKPKGCK